MRPRLTAHDRLFWVILRRFWPDWKRVLVIVHSETVVGWHRVGFKLYGKWISRRRMRSDRKPTPNLDARPAGCVGPLAKNLRAREELPEDGDPRGVSLRPRRAGDPIWSGYTSGPARQEPRLLQIGDKQEVANECMPCSGLSMQHEGIGDQGHGPFQYGVALRQKVGEGA